MAKTFDRNQFKSANIVEMKKEEQEVNALVGNKTEGEFLSLSPGFNKVRWFPSHPDSLSTSFLLPKAVSWLPQEVWVKKDDEKYEVREPSDEQKTKGEVKLIVKRKPIFNSKVHGGTLKDIVEEYINFTTKAVSQQFAIDKKSQDELKKRLDPITNWQTGIGTKTSFIGYAKLGKNDGSHKFGRLEVTWGVKEQHNVISNTGSADSTIVMDPFTNPDTGKAVNINYDKNNADKKKIYQTNILFAEDAKLTDAELETFLQSESLEKLYKNSFKRSDYEKQLAGLQIFDRENKFFTFEADSFLNIVEEIDSWYQSTDTQSEGEASTATSDVQSEAIQEQMESEGISCLNQFTSKEDLVKFIEFCKLDVQVRAIHTLEKVKENVSEAVLETPGLILDQQYDDYCAQNQNRVKTENEQTGETANTATTSTSDRMAALKSNLSSKS